MLRYIHKQRKNKKGYTLKVESGGKVSIITNTKFSKVEVDKIVVKNMDWILFAKKKQILKHKENEGKLASLKITKSKISVAKGISLDYLSARSSELAKKLQVEHLLSGISIKDYRTKWGTCDSKGNVTFNWRLLLLPRVLSDYIIVHELCHLKHLNHSTRFWNFVSEYCENYKEIRKVLGNDYHLLMTLE